MRACILAACGYETSSSIEENVRAVHVTAPSHRLPSRAFFNFKSHLTTPPVPEPSAPKLRREACGYQCPRVSRSHVAAFRNGSLCTPSKRRDQLSRGFASSMSHQTPNSSASNMHTTRSFSQKAFNGKLSLTPFDSLIVVLSLASTHYQERPPRPSSFKFMKRSVLPECKSCAKHANDKGYPGGEKASRPPLHAALCKDPLPCRFSFQPPLLSLPCLM